MNEPIATPEPLKDRYRLERLLGVGGQGRTWLARRTRDDHPVAIKALHLAHVDNWKAVELFEREAKVLQGLDIDGVPRLYEYVSAPDAGDGPSFFLVQELVEGETLAASIARGQRYREAEVVALADQLLVILDALHRLSPPVVHRDLKPANVMVRPDGRCALLDFGAVTDSMRSAGEGGSTVAGTFGYMAPEQFHGRATPASDLYALGATMVHLLAGKPPSAMEMDMFRLHFRPHVNASPPLLGVLDRLLEPDERQRVSNAADARQLLERLGAEPASASAAADARGTELATVATFADVVALGQPGSMALFHGAGAPPRSVPAVYTRRVAGRAALLVVGGGIGTFAAMSGILGIFGLGPMELLMVVALPFVLTWALMRGARRMRRLIRHGERADGTVRGVRSKATSIVVAYDFTVRGEVLSGACNLARADVLLSVGDTVGVLYDPKDPTSSMVYPLPVASVLNVFDED